MDALDWAFLRVVAIIFLMFCGVTVGALLTAYKLDSMRCEATAKAMNLEPRYTSLTGCMVKVNDFWWPLKSLGV